MGSNQSVSRASRNASLPSLHPPPHLHHRYSCSSISGHHLRKSSTSINQRMGTLVVRSSNGRTAPNALFLTSHDPSVIHYQDMDMYLVSQIARCLGVRLLHFFSISGSLYLSSFFPSFLCPWSSFKFLFHVSPLKSLFKEQIPPLIPAPLYSSLDMPSSSHLSVLLMPVTSNVGSKFVLFLCKM